MTGNMNLFKNVGMICVLFERLLWDGAFIFTAFKDYCVCVFGSFYLLVFNYAWLKFFKCFALCFKFLPSIVVLCTLRRLWKRFRNTTAQHAGWFIYFKSSWVMIMQHSGMLFLTWWNDLNHRSKVKPKTHKEKVLFPRYNVTSSCSTPQTGVSLHF